MIRVFNILLILALVTYSSSVTVIPLQGHRVSRPVLRSLSINAPAAGVVINNVESITYSGLIQVGTPPQNFSVIFDTGFSDMIFFANCQNCTSINQYNIAASNTSQDQMFDYQFNFYTDDNVVTGEVYEDYITIGGKYSVLAEFFVLNQPLNTINTQYDGIVGLNYQGLNPQYPLTTLMQLLQIANTTIPSVFSIYLTPNINQTGGSLIIGDYNELIAPNGFANWYPVAAGHTWSLDIKDFGFNGTSFAEQQGLSITLASGLPYIVAGSGVFNELLARLPGTANCQNLSNAGSFYLNIGGDIYNIPGASLYPNISGTCTLNLQSAVAAGYSDISDDEIWVGIPFFQNYYVMFNAENQSIGITTPAQANPPVPVPFTGAAMVSISMICTLIASFLYLLM